MSEYKYSVKENGNILTVTCKDKSVGIKSEDTPKDKLISMALDSIKMSFVDDDVQSNMELYDSADDELKRTLHYVATISLYSANDITFTEEKNNE